MKRACLFLPIVGLGAGMLAAGFAGETPGLAPDRPPKGRLASAAGRNSPGAGGRLQARAGREPPAGKRMAEQGRTGGATARPGHERLPWAQPPPTYSRANPARGGAAATMTGSGRLLPAVNPSAGQAQRASRAGNMEQPRGQPGLPSALRPSSLLPVAAPHIRGPALATLGGPAGRTGGNTAALNGTGVRRRP